MASDGQVNIGIKISADNSGAQKAEQSLNRVGTAAKRTSAESKSGFDQMRNAAGKVTGTVGLLRNALTGFGIVGFATGIISGISKVIDSFGEAKKAAEEFNAIQTKLAEEKRIAQLANDYAKLKDAISAAAESEKHQLDMIDRRVASRRKLEAAELEAAKEDEISNLDTSAKDYAEQLDKIEKKYAAIKAARESSNAKEDIVLQRQKLNTQARQEDKQAEAQYENSNVIEEKIEQEKKKLEEYKKGSKSLNDKDAPKRGKIGTFFRDIWNLIGLGNGRVGSRKTDEGDAVRKENAEKAAETEKRIQELQEELRKSDVEAEKHKENAKNRREEANAMGVDLQASAISGETARSAAARGETAAQTALDKNHADQAAEAAKVSDARKAQQLLSQQKAELEARIEQEKAKKTAADYSVFTAQGAVDQARLGGNRREQRSATAALQEAQNAAQNVNHAADTAINALTEVLNRVEAKLKQAQSVLERNSKQQANYNVEVPAGS